MKAEKILVIGESGQLAKSLQQADLQAQYLGRHQLDLEKPSSIESFFQDQKVDVLVNVAAYTQVDKAESEKAKAHMVNAAASQILARYARSYFYISTDYVYSGAQNTPYTEDDATDPVNYYGFTKLQGEVLAQQENDRTFILRTSWLYSPFGMNFVKRMADLGKTRESLNVVFDQIGTPTWAPDLADAIKHMISHKHDLTPGVFHYSNEGVCSWYDWAVDIVKSSGGKAVVNPIRSGEFPTPAARPAFSVLDKTKIKQSLRIRIPHWTESFERCKAQMF